MIFCCFGRPATVESTYDPRFGAPDISAPHEGAYSNPEHATVPTIDVPNPLQLSPVYRSESIENNDKVNESLPQSPTSLKRVSFMSSFSARSSGSQTSPAFQQTKVSDLPVHQAYIPGGRESIRESVREGDSIKATASSLSSPSASTHITTPITTPTTGGSTHTWPNPSPKLSQIQTKRASYNPKGGLERTMRSEQPQSRPPIHLDPVPQKRGPKRHEWTPDSANSVEQWPGTY